MRGLASVGDILAQKYRVERILGIGGMGMVVLATHMELDQAVAIKFMLPAALDSPEAGVRFMREARAAGRLTSEHVCRVSDVGRFDTGVPYIVMEYLEGHDLGTLLKRKGPLPVAQAIDYILQASEGMAEAHGHGIVHRDLKPDNLFLALRSDGSEIVKVLDFGISKASVTGIATKTGDIMGSPAYMAPEQMQSTKDVDARADVWSLGVILYQLISGRMPFIADTLPALCLAVINEPPPSLESIRKDLPSGLAEAVMKCLAKHKDERFRNVHELAQALAPFGKPESMGAAARIRSMLQRKRPPTQPPLIMLPSEFSDVAPTVVGTGDSLDIPNLPSAARTPLPPKATRTTIGSSLGESMSVLAPRHQVNRGVVGALIGAIALVGLIIAMVLIKREATTDTAAAAAAGPPPPPPASDPRPIVEPPPPPPTINAPTGPPIDATQPDDLSQITIETPAPATPHWKPVGTKTKAPKGSAAVPPADEQDKWDHMHHDREGEEVVPPPMKLQGTP